MKYFMNESEREDTAFHEFYRGKWDGKSFWRKDSILLHDDVLVEHKGFYKALYKAIPEYDRYDCVEVLADSWAEVRNFIPEEDCESIELYEEADMWAQAVLKEDGCFFILGL